MSDDPMMKQLNSLIEHLKSLLGRFANEHGVQVQYNQSKPHMIRFRFHTEDDVPMVVTYDINATSKEYINNLVRGVQHKLREHRKARHASPIIIPGMH